MPTHVHGVTVRLWCRGHADDPNVEGDELLLGEFEDDLLLRAARLKHVEDTQPDGHDPVSAHRTYRTVELDANGNEIRLDKPPEAGGRRYIKIDGEFVYLDELAPLILGDDAHAAEVAALTEEPADG